MHVVATGCGAAIVVAAGENSIHQKRKAALVAQISPGRSNLLHVTVNRKAEASCLSLAFRACKTRGCEKARLRLAVMVGLEDGRLIVLTLVELAVSGVRWKGALCSEGVR